MILHTLRKETIKPTTVEKMVVAPSGALAEGATKFHYITPEPLLSSKICKKVAQIFSHYFCHSARLIFQLRCSIIILVKGIGY